MISSRGMGAMLPNKMPKGKKKARRDDTDFTQYKEGGVVKAAGGLYANIAAKKKRIASGSGEKMRSAGSAGAPKKGDFANAAKTARFAGGGEVKEDSNVKFGVQNPRLNLDKNAKELSGRLTAEKQLGKNTSLQAYLDANINKRGPGVQGGGVNLTHRFAEGGLAQQAATAIAMKAKGVKPKKMAKGGKSTVNAAGNYTKPELRKRIFNAVKAEATAGTGAGQWSARKAQMVAQRYKKAGGGYRD